MMTKHQQLFYSEFLSLWKLTQELDFLNLLKIATAIFQK